MILKESLNWYERLDALLSRLHNLKGEITKTHKQLLQMRSPANGSLLDLC